MEAEIGKRVVGQEEAVIAVSARHPSRARWACKIPHRPIGSFMFSRA
jgi:ATP-dependent Clp protease ATP-binding subunit ClpA